MLSNGGLDDDHIVVMMADDLASNYMNPHPGKVFNRPGGHDVYKGVPLVQSPPLLCVAPQCFCIKVILRALARP